MNARKAFERVVVYTMAVVMVVLSIGPLLWLVLTSISPRAELLAIPPHWIPNNPTIQNYVKLLLGGEAVLTTTRYYKQALINSTVVSFATMAISLAAGVPAAYAFSRRRFKGRSFLFYGIVLLQLIPIVALIIPLYIVINSMGLTNTRLSLIIGYNFLNLPFVIWIMKNYFDTIPENLEDAAAIDGCSPWGALVRVVLPLSAPGLTSAAIFSFLTAWAEFFMALVFTSTYSAKTLPVLVAEFSGRYSINYGLMATSTVIASVIPITLALIFQRYIVQGLTGGSIKG